MINEKDVESLANSMRESDKTFAEFIAELFKDKLVEIYLGDTYEQVSTEQISVSYPAVFCGKVITAYKECLVLNCPFVNENRKMQLGNLMFINERGIRALNEIDGNGVMQDMFLKSNESLVLKKMFK